MSPEDYAMALQDAQKQAIMGLIPKPEVAEHVQQPDSDLYDVTYYCPCPKCCGHSSPESGGHGLTASGRPPVAGETIAADWSVLPKGSRVNIEGVGMRTVHDTGGAIKGKRIDIFMPTHEEALKGGRKKLRVTRVEDENAGSK